MKKTFIAATAMAMLAAVCATGCEVVKPKETFTVTFVQTGQTDVVKTVEKGATLTDIPAPKDKTGYTVTWNTTEFSNVSQNITVTAIETANEYTITYQPGNGTLDSLTQTVTYDAECTLKVPVNQDAAYTFTCWTRADNTSVAQTGTWKIAENVTLTAQYAEPYTVSFVQEGYETIVLKVAEGGSLAADAIPAPQAKEGYTVCWDRTEFENITQSVVVNAVATANEYTVTYRLGERAEDENATLPTTAQTVRYDDSATLCVPECYGYRFVGWVVEGTDTPVASGMWKIARNVTLTAIWEIDENSDRWWSENQ